MQVCNAINIRRYVYKEIEGSTLPTFDFGKKQVLVHIPVFHYLFSKCQVLVHFKSNFDNLLKDLKKFYKRMKNENMQFAFLLERRTKACPGPAEVSSKRSIWIVPCPSLYFGTVPQQHLTHMSGNPVIQYH